MLKNFSLFWTFVIYVAAPFDHCRRDSATFSKCDWIFYCIFIEQFGLKSGAANFEMNWPARPVNHRFNRFDKRRSGFEFKV